MIKYKLIAILAYENNFPIGKANLRMKFVERRSLK